MKYRTIMNMYYEDYGNDAVQPRKLTPPYLVICENYANAMEFCNVLEALGFTNVYGLGEGYRVVLVNLEKRRFSGISKASNYANSGEYSRRDFEETVLEDYINQTQYEV